MLNIANYFGLIKYPYYICNVKSIKSTSVMMVKVIEKNNEGKNLLKEIHPTITKGDIILVSKFYPSTGCVEFKWHGNDACLWMGKNCEEYYASIKKRTKLANKPTKFSKTQVVKL